MPQPVFDVITIDKGNSRSSTTFNHTVTGANPILLVFVGALHIGSPKPSVTSISFGGNNLSSVDGQNIKIGSGPGASNLGFELHVLLAPPTGTFQVSIIYNTTTDADCIMAISYDSADQATGLAALVGVSQSSGQPSLPISTLSGDSIVVGGYVKLGGDAFPATPGAGIVERWDEQTGTSPTTDIAKAGGELSTLVIGDFVFAYTSSNNNAWCGIVVEIIPFFQPSEAQLDLAMQLDDSLSLTMTLKEN